MNPDLLAPIPGQLVLNPISPKEGTVKRSVLRMLHAHPEGLCRRDFAGIDVYEVSARIGELQRDGWSITSRPCSRHKHRPESHFVEYLI